VIQTQLQIKIKLDEFEIWLTDEKTAYPLRSSKINLFKADKQ
jgi:hypothetical protein